MREVATEDDHLVGVCQPDWESIYHNVDGEAIEEDQLSYSDASAAISILVGWMCHSSRQEPADPRTVAAKCEAVLFWLDPNQSKYRSLSEIGCATGLTRAAISKQLLGLKDQLGSAVSVGKLGSTRSVYRKAQLDCLERGNHSSQVRKRKKVEA